MSTEHLNTNNAPQTIDPEREKDMLAFVASMNKSTSKLATPNKRHQCKWIVALKRRFRRRSLTLIATAAATLLLAGVMVLIITNWKDTSPHVGGSTSTDPNTTEPTVTTQQIPLLDKTSQADTNKKTHLQQVSIHNTDDAYTILYDKASDTYVIQGYEDIALSVQMMLTLRHYTETIQAVNKVKEASDLSVYGLAKPQATADISYADGSSTRLSIGNKTPSETGYYGQIQGDDSVYIFDTESASLFRHRSAAFVDMTLISPPAVKEGDKNGKALLKDITYSGTAHPTPLVMRRSNHQDSEELAYFSYVITAPFLRCTSDAVSSALSSIQSLSADQALYLHPTNEQKEKLGFNNPLIQIDTTLAVETEETGTSNESDEAKPKIYYGSKEYKLIIGSKDENGNYIAMLEGINVIFLIKKDSYNYLLDRTYQNSVNEYLFFKNITSIDRISVEYNGEKHDFHLAHYPEAENPNDQLVITEGKKVYSTEEFRELYELVMALERRGVPDAEPTGNVVLTISLYDTDGNLYLGADYYETTASLCTVKTSQGEWITTLWSDVSFFIDQVQNYLDGKNVLIKN